MLGFCARRHLEEGVHKSLRHHKSAPARRLRHSQRSFESALSTATVVANRPDHTLCALATVVAYPLVPSVVQGYTTTPHPPSIPHVLATQASGLYANSPLSSIQHTIWSIDPSSFLASRQCRSRGLLISSAYTERASLFVRHSCHSFPDIWLLVQRFEL